MNDNIDDKLKAWKVEAEAPARFQAGVWERIANSDRARGHSPTFLFATLFALLAKPRYAVAFASLVLLASFATAKIEALETNSAIWKNLETRYVVSIDPRAQALALR